MKHNLAIFALFSMGLAAASGAAAQDKMTDKKMDSSGSTTVTGCLAQGSGASDYTIRDANGKTYSLMGTKVNLKPHVGHQVSITGTSANTSGNTSGQAGDNLQVSSLKMISSTCQ